MDENNKSYISYIYDFENFELEPHYRKDINKLIDSIIIEASNNNIQMFGFTINILYENYYFELKESNFELYKTYVRKEIQHYLKEIDSIPMMSFIYLAPEKNSKGLIHLHGIIGLKSILGFNNKIESNILNYLMKGNTFDIKVDKLNSFEDKKKWFRYCTKTIGWGYDNCVTEYIDSMLDWTDEKFKNRDYPCICHHFYTYDNIINQSYSTFIEFVKEKPFEHIVTSTYIEQIKEKEFNNKLKSGNKLIIKRECLIYLNTGNFLNKYERLGSFPEKEKDYNEWTIVNFVNFYLQYNNNYINENGIFKKVKNSIFSVELIYDREELIEKLQEIYMSLVVEFKIQLENLDFYTLKTRYFYKFEELFIKTNQFFLNWIVPDLSIIEWSDIIYITTFDKTLPKSFFKENNISLETTMKYSLKYYNKTYKNTKIPKNYLECLENALGKKETVEDFCEKLGYILAINVKPKRNQETIYIHGNSQTGKSIFIKTLFKKLFGPYIGEITKSNTFKFENLLKKKIAILDEFEHYKIAMDILLKLLEGNEVTIDRKHKESKKTQLIKFIMISNNKLKVKDKMIEEALNSRIKYFEFTGKFLNKRNEFEEVIQKLEKEEDAMIKYCIKLFFKKNVYKSKKKAYSQKKKFIEYFFPELKKEPTLKKTNINYTTILKSKTSLL